MKKPHSDSRRNMLAPDLFELEKVQVFDSETGKYICTMKLYNTTGDTRQLSEYTPIIEPEKGKNKNQLQLF